MPRKPSQGSSSMSRLRRLHEHAAGIDVGASSHWVALPPESCSSPVREFGAYTCDLHALAAWLQDHEVTTVAMESTGVYWIPLYELLVERQFDVYLVDARATKQVAGRKTDVSDCQWIQQLHSYGLLKRAFIPDDTISALRSYMRQRTRWVTDAGRAIQHMQQALELMNVKLTEVLADITGVTGLAIIDAILAGERDPNKLAELRDCRCKKPVAEIARALEGHWRAEHLFALQQAVRHYRYLTQCITDCDQQIEHQLQRLPDQPTEAPPSGTPKRSRSPYPFAFDAHAHCQRVAGVDLTTIPGVNVGTVMCLLSEVGPDLSAWAHEKQFGAWLGLAPNPRKSGGRVLRSHTKAVSHRLAQAFRLAANALLKSQSALGANFRRLRARLGPAKAITALAYKIAKLVYRMLKSHQPYNDIGPEQYDQRKHSISPMTS